MDDIFSSILGADEEMLSEAVFALNAKTDLDDETLWLPLIVHLQDTAAVMEYLLRHWLPEQYCEGLDLNRKEFFQLALFTAFVHDIGKATPSFQRKITRQREILGYRLEKNGLTDQAMAWDKEPPHAAAGAEILRAEGVAECVAAVVGAHHGMPEQLCMPSFGEESPSAFGWNEQSRDTPWGGVQRELIAWALGKIGVDDPRDLPECTVAAQMALTGLVIMADWIASNTAFFPLISEDALPWKYDPRRAENGLGRLHLPSPWEVSDDWKTPWFFLSRFGFSENIVQKETEKIAVEMKTPGIMIIEAPMGQGKTEAALSAAEILMNRFHLSGAAFFLPSQATSNAMFTRMTAWAKQQPEASGIAVSLVHGQAEFNEEFRQLEEGSVAVNECEPDSLLVHTFFRGRKTKLLANLVVGTVDQLLMAALRQKHVMLRHLGLTGKVVIIDECHAYDAYMNVYLDCALKWLSAYHVPVILLSATLPGKRRKELLKAYSGARIHPTFRETQEYPLISWTDGACPCQVAIAPEGVGRTVCVQKASQTQAIAELGEAIACGCAGFIVNTVGRAQKLWSLLKKAYPNAAILMDHSRYLTPDRLRHEQEILRRVGKTSAPEQRRGVLVIGTQVLEQSLDLDFDLLVTDLCPMDLLMQRIGRLQRHSRQRPSGLETPRCLVLGAQGDLDKGSRHVYGDYLLMRTQALLPEEIWLPQDISPLVQKTYDETLWSPESSPQYEEAKNQYQEFQKMQRGRANSYCMAAPSRDGFFETIVGLLDDTFGFTDLQAQAAVRDGTAAIEVLVVQQCGDGRIRLLTRGSDSQFRADTQPSAEQCRILAAQRLRLPAYLGKSDCVDAVIGDLEKRMKQVLPIWLQAPMLQGELFMILDPDGTAELNGKRFYYDLQTGFAEKEEENA